MVGFWNGQKTKFMKNKLSPLVPYLQILAIFGHECDIKSLYGSWTTHRNKKLSKQTTRAKVNRGCDNRSVAILTDLPVFIAVKPNKNNQTIQKKTIINYP